MDISSNPAKFARFILYFLFTIFFFTKGIYFFLKNPGYQNTIAKAFIFLIIIFLAANGINKSLKYSEKLWEIDRSHEILSLNAANSYAEKGFGSNFGLPDFDYPKTPRIYTHLPPGPYLLAGALVKICGKNELSCARLLSTAISTFALLFFAVMLFFALGPCKSAVLMFIIAMIPMTGNIMHTITYTSYAFSLFIIQLGFLLYFFKKKVKLNISSLSILFILGFIQGWFSFEYFFLISLSALPFALLYSQLDQREDKKRLILAILLPIMGFCFAFLLHFIQNAFYFGSIMGAFNDFHQIGGTRMLSSPSENPAFSHTNMSRIKLLLNYFFVYPRSWHYFILNLPIFLGVTFILIWFKDIRLTIQTPIKVTLKWVSSRRNYFVILTALLASFLWLIIMSHHAAGHTHMLPRLLFFSYFVCILTILECISLDHSPKSQ